MLFWPFCCCNKSYAAQQRKFGIFTASFLPYVSPSLWNTPQHSQIKEAVNPAVIPHKLALHIKSCNSAGSSFANAFL